MKKILLGTSALLVAGFVATAANAAPVKLNVGGYANWYTGYVDGNSAFDKGTVAQPTAYNHTPVLGDVELAFTGETALDNGLKFGAVIEMTADDSTASGEDNVDQTYTYMDSAYGRVVMGKMDGISRQFHTASKDVGLLGIQDSDAALFLPTVAGASMIGGMSTDIRQVDKVTGIHYISPKMNGFTVATSYVDGDDNATSNNGDDAAAYVATVAYGNKLGAFDVGADVSYAGYDAEFDGAGELDKEISTGARVGYEGFTFGAGYKYSQVKGLGADRDIDTFDVGVAYEKGPYGASLAYIYSKEEVTTATDIERDLLLLSGKYNVSAGVDTFVSFGYATVDQTGAAEPKAYVAATGLGLTF